MKMTQKIVRLLKETIYVRILEQILCTDDLISFCECFGLLLKMLYFLLSSLAL